MKITKDDKNTILQNVSNQNKILAANVIDKAFLCEKTKSVVFTDFLDMLQQSEIKIILNKLGVYYQLFGGYNDSERKVLIIHPQNDMNIHDDVPLGLINIRYNTKFAEKLSHRDVLGSILSLGVNRDKVGDILIHDGFIQVIVMNEITSYIENNLTKIRNFGVDINVANLEEISTKQQEFKEITSVVPSLRLDCIVESGCGISRSSSVKLIQAQSVSVNWKVINKSSYEIKESDVISVRGYGRFVFDSVKGTTKKDNFVVLIKKLL